MGRRQQLRRDRAASRSATACTASRDLVEKPPRDEAPSDLAIIGRYILTPDIFDDARRNRRDRTGEIQLTNGLRQLLKNGRIYAYEVDGVRHDTGNKLGFPARTVRLRAAPARPRRAVPEYLERQLDCGGGATLLRALVVAGRAGRTRGLDELESVFVSVFDSLFDGSTRWSRSSTRRPSWPRRRRRPSWRSP